MVCAIFRYSVLFIIPKLVVPVLLVLLGCAMFIKLRFLVFLVLICVVVCVSSCRNVAWFTSIPLMFMYSGSVL
jgi:hypothetical protein